jgi:hypothetical protein
MLCITTLLRLRSARLKLTSITPQRFLLAEIIKTSKVSIDTLLGIIKKEHIEPDWSEIFLPQGKSIRTLKLKAPHYFRFLYRF